jgi:hypothetical protein
MCDPMKERDEALKQAKVLRECLDLCLATVGLDKDTTLEELVEHLDDLRTDVDESDKCIDELVAGGEILFTLLHQTKQRLSSMSNLDSETLDLLNRINAEISKTPEDDELEE